MTCGIALLRENIDQKNNCQKQTGRVWTECSLRRPLCFAYSNQRQESPARQIGVRSITWNNVTHLCAAVLWERWYIRGLQNKSTDGYPLS